MSFPLGSLRGDDAAGASSATYTRSSKKKPPAPVEQPMSRGVTQLWLFVGAILLLLVVLALLTRHPADAAFSTSGTGELPRNKVGTLGAWGADMLLFLFGYSGWWLVLVGLRHWLGSLAGVLRVQDGNPQLDRGFHPPVWAFWLGLALLMCSSCALEWTRLYLWEGRLPGQAGGVLGSALGPLSMRALGFAGSGVVWIAMLLVSLSLALRFSWLRVAEALGTWIDRLRVRHHQRVEQAEDKRVGQKAQREREKVAAVERHVVEEHVPIVIEPPVVVTPPSERVAKERQKPLFTELADTKLPQVDLLDAAPGRVESVTPESLEMTSRLIEKKLRDFGVEVRVVAASPGPVITRYEIEPATGVKGSQIVNLAKDLARSLSLISIRVVEVIPGKNYMALELPNARRQTIRLRNPRLPGLQRCLLAADDGPGQGHHRPAGGGRPGQDAALPGGRHHRLGQVGGHQRDDPVAAVQGRSRDVRLILIDPKMLEMSVYEGIPHLLAPVVTDMKQAATRSTGAWAKWSAATS
jgi:S-DNA-T family DNA segregation ATPase FtsK/SpoIIIE